MREDLCFLGQLLLDPPPFLQVLGPLLTLELLGERDLFPDLASMLLKHELSLALDLEFLVALGLLLREDMLELVTVALGLLGETLLLVELLLLACFVELLLDLLLRKVRLRWLMLSTLFSDSDFSLWRA